MLKYHLQAILANVVWGSLSIYFYFIGEYPPLLILSVQIISTFFILSVFVLSVRVKNIKLKNLYISIVPSVLLTLNWGGYAVAVRSGFVIEASYAYLILPILLLTISLLIDRESDLSKKISIATCLFIIFTDCYINGVFPTIGFAISIPFAAYILWHNKYNQPPLDALFYETLLMLPTGVGLYIYMDGGSIAQAEVVELIGLLMLGVITVIPLTLFVSSSKKVSFNILSIYQLISPILGMCIGIYLYNQNLETHSVLSYCALILVLITYNFRNLKGNKNESPQSAK